MTMRNHVGSALLLLGLLIAPIASFVVGSQPQRSARATQSLVVRSSTSTPQAEENDILKPSYDIEPIPIRIGHGFDIHRMAPIQEAGQPVIIGGVEITHKDQKVGSGAEGCCARC